LIPWIMVGTYALVIVLAGRSVLASEGAQRAAVVDQLETTLHDQVAAWEDGLFGVLTEWMEIAAAATDRGGQRQDQMRRRAPWFNALYLWEVPRRVVIGHEEVQTAPQVLFPPPQRADSRDTPMARRCIHRARLLAAQPDLTPLTVAGAYVIGCEREGLLVRMIAAREAANFLENHVMYDEALDALQRAGVPESLTLRGATRDDVPPFELAMHRLMHAGLLTHLSRSDEALTLIERVGLEIAALDAPHAEPLLQYIRWPILPQLRRSKHLDAAERVELAANRAERRVAAFRELTERVVHQVPRPTATEAPRFIRDQYTDPPFLLFYGWPNRQGVALQLEQGPLLTDFLSSKGVARLRRWLVVTDLAGTLVDGSRRGRPVAISVPYNRTLTHLRVGLREDAIEARMERTRSQITTQLWILAICALLGFVALVAQIRATRKQTELLRRQREFTTRVTHELKTPLAGIRLMAENLETGAFRDAGQRSEMAGRIVQEADRLTDRVDEVLASTRERIIPDPEPFDPEESLLEAIDQWGPRLEAAGIRLHADLHTTGEVVGDRRAIRDAVGCLLDNALKYRKPVPAQSQVWLDLKPSGPWVEITVTDNGLGVPPDMRTAIFDRFVRVEGANRGKGGGHGLGLAQVAAIVHAHRGTVRCTEGVDGGARFIVALPADPE